MKNILIYGTSRSGKTSIGKFLSENLDHNFICGDSFVSAFEKSMPELCITHKDRTGKSVENIQGFLWEYINSMNKKDKKSRGINFILESAYFDIYKLKQEIDKYIVIILLGEYNTPNDVLEQLNMYDKEYDWTFHLNDIEKQKYAEHLFYANNNLKKFCEQNNLKYFITNFDRDKTFKEILNFVKERL